VRSLGVVGADVNADDALELAASGLLVHARYSIRRVLTHMNTSAYSRRRRTVSTVKKSHASIVAAC